MEKLNRDEFMRIYSNILGLQQKALEDAGLPWSVYHNHLPTREEMWDAVKDIPVLDCFEGGRQ